MLRGSTHICNNQGEGSSGDAEWLALLYALAVALAGGETEVLLLGDSASVIDQAKGKARRRASPELQSRFDALIVRFDGVRFRRIRRTQNLAGIALEQVRRRSPSR